MMDRTRMTDLRTKESVGKHRSVRIRPVAWESILLFQISCFLDVVPMIFSYFITSGTGLHAAGWNDHR